MGKPCAFVGEAGASFFGNRAPVLGASSRTSGPRSCHRMVVMRGGAAKSERAPSPKPVTRRQAVAKTAQAPVSDADLSALQKVTDLQNEAFRLTDQMNYAKAEVIWTQIIGLNEKNAPAWSNRGNCRTSQGRFEEAIADFDKAIALAPEEPDPYLGRGVAREGLFRYKDSLQDYERANTLSVSRYGYEDPVTFNNRGNAYAGLGQWEEAVKFYSKASSMNRNYVFALANEALARYQLGETDQALTTMRFLARKYPGFADMHAALAAAYWHGGNPSASESEWARTMDIDVRYKDLNWIKSVRRWPPKLVDALEQFQKLK